MTVSEVIKKMVAYSEGNLHDINHFMKVYAYAKTIAEGENLNPELQKLVEVTAVVHDIACPLCRVKYGNTNGKHQPCIPSLQMKQYASERHSHQTAI